MQAGSSSSSSDATGDEVCELQPGWPLALPGPPQHTFVSQLLLADKRSLRLTCKTATALVDSCIKRLHLSLDSYRQAAGTLPQRFPAAATLALEDDDSTGTAANSTQRQLVESPEAWFGVTSLNLTGCSLHTAAQLLPSFPNVADLGCHKIVPCDAGPPLQALCQQLTGLRSLRLRQNAHLNEHPLAVAAALPALTRLAVADVAVQEQAWDVLSTNVRGLQALSVQHIGAGPPMTLDLRSMTSLTELEWVRRHPHHLYQQVTLELPSSLVHLRLEEMPYLLTMPVLPHLASLELSQGEAGVHLLKWAAAHCKSLARLDVHTLWFCSSCASTPLTALTALAVYIEKKERGSKLAYGKAFPALQRLTLHRMAQPGITPRYDGLTALACLHLSGLGSRGTAFEEGDVETLAQLPGLTALQAAVHAHTVQSMGGVTQLRSVEWVWDHDLQPIQHDSQALYFAFEQSFPPQELRCISFKFNSIAPWLNALADDWVVGGAALWLCRPPLLAEVKWVWWSEQSPPYLTPERLSMIANNTSIKHLVFRGYGTSTEFEPDLQDVVQKLVHRGLQVTLSIS